MKKIINYFDFLWKGDRETLISMWLVIILAAVLVAQMLVTLYLQFHK